MKKMFFLLLTISLFSACSNPRPSSTAVPLQDTGAPSSSGNPSGTVSGGIEPFTIENMNTELPDDIIQEIGYFGGLGGGCGKRLCECEFNNYQTPSVFTIEKDIEFLTDIPFEVCGVAPEENINVLITFPDQTQKQYQFSGVDFEYTPLPPDRIGNYHFVFSGSGWSLEKNVEVIDTNGPRLFLGKDNTLIFYRFEPNERIRLFAYQDAKLRGWKEYRAGNDGTLITSTNIEADFIALGEFSGQVFDQKQGEPFGSWAVLGSRTDIYCQKVKPIGVIPGGYAEVIDTSNSLPIYESVNNNGTWTEQNIGTLQKGDIVRILSNATCKDGTFWWNIYCEGASCHSFIPESGPNGPYLRPLK